MTEPAIAIAFFDPEHGLHGSARAGATLLYDGDRSNVLAAGPQLERRGGAWRAELEDAFSLELKPVAGPARLGDVTAYLCEVKGNVGGTKLKCLGTVGEAERPPQWAELDVVRSISAVFDRAHAFLALATRPRGAAGHGQEEVAAWLLHGGEPLSVVDARISTVYDGEGRQRSAGFELWLPDEDLPRRGSGTVLAGSSLQLEGVDVHAAVFRWHMEDREGAGAYELTVRRDPPAAA